MSSWSIRVLRLRRWVLRIVGAALIFVGVVLTFDFVEVGVVSPQVFGGLLSWLVAFGLLRSRWVRRTPAERPAHRLDVACLAVLAGGWFALAAWVTTIDASHMGVALPGVRCGTFYQPKGRARLVSALVGCDEAVQSQFMTVVAAAALSLICMFFLVRLLVRVAAGRHRDAQQTPVRPLVDWAMAPALAAEDSNGGALGTPGPHGPRRRGRGGRIWFGVAAVALLIGLIVTALNGSKPTAEDRSFDRLYDTALPADVQPPDPCKLLTGADVHASLGGPPIEAASSSQTSNLADAANGQRSCFWSAGSDDALVSLRVITAQSESAAHRAMQHVEGMKEFPPLPLRSKVTATAPELRPGQVLRKGPLTWQMLSDLGHTAVLFENAEAEGGGTFVMVSSEDGVAYFTLSASGFPPTTQRAGLLALAREVSTRLAGMDH